MKTPLRVLYVGLKYDYGDPSRGFSYEHVHFFDTLRRMDRVQVAFFPYDEVMRREGREGMNRSLLRAVDEQRPDICFFVLFTDEITPRTVEHITGRSGVVTLNWFGDDHWRFRPYSRSWAPRFHWVVTTDAAAVEKYRLAGCRNVVLSQWGFNHHVIQRRNVPEEFDVTFVGQVHSRRGEVINDLRRAGIGVQCWGRGWPNGRLGQEEMIAMYARSRINLNFTESSVVSGWKRWAKVVLNRRADDSLHLRTPLQVGAHLRTLFNPGRPQIKGRNFEIPGAGGFLLTSDADGLGEYFVPGKEIGLFRSTEDLLDRIRYYLAHHDERESVRRAGHARALRDHTYERRFRDLFATLGFGLQAGEEN